nr:MAG: hypothetical protein [Microvirus sp.]
MIFNTPYERTRTPEEPNSGEILTEQSGYISAQQQIEDLIMAGQRLDESRVGYEFQEGEEIPDDYYSPLNHPNIDIVDADNFLRAQTEKLDSQAKASVKKSAPLEPIEETPKVHEPTDLQPKA